MNPQEAVAVVVFGVLAVALALLWTAPHRRKAKRHQRLDYSVAQKVQSPVLTATRSLIDFHSAFAWGTPSVDTWRRACDASIKASRRRRGLGEENHGDV